MDAVFYFVEKWNIERQAIISSSTLMTAQCYSVEAKLLVLLDAMSLFSTEEPYHVIIHVMCVAEKKQQVVISQAASDVVAPDSYIDF